MDSVRKVLTACFYFPIVVCLLMVLVFESDWVEPWFDTDAVMVEYYLAIVMEIGTICFIPLAVRLFKFGFVHRDFERNAVPALQKWGVVRLDMLSIPMMVNTFLYYQFMNVAFGYLAIIGLLSMCFVYPSAARCEQETGNEG